MIYRFDPFELDTDKVELRGRSKPVAVEPQVFGLLALLIENRERLVSKDEIIEKVWEGRIVSDSAVASRIKSARKALGDDGVSQRYIKTIHGQGFRFVAGVRVAGTVEAAVVHNVPDLPPSCNATRPSIAILPFRIVGNAGSHATTADALPDELIAELARLRWLFITARGSSFRLSTKDTDMCEIGRLLGVRYCLTGTVEASNSRLIVIIELADTRDAAVVWAERFSGSVDDVHRIRQEIRSKVLASLDIQIPLYEATLARHTVTENLDAWEAYHLGLQHMYRFNRQDNKAAIALFQQAVERDPGFARAHAGLSFSHFQTAFMHYSQDVTGDIALARRFAERGIELDPIDPFVNFTMGRTFWLRGDLDSSLGWFERAASISPNFAQGIYARAWTESLAGKGMEARENIDLAMRLSPIDPLHYAMLATRAFTHIASGEDLEAANWAERAARSPGAHVLIAMIAVVAHALSGNEARAKAWSADVRTRNATLTQREFFQAFPMKAQSTVTRVSKALGKFGF
ncbi:MAG TPA: winged helix-turn-helix domain-containing protein [Steroidobacteraceae bacterium]|jgi:TolB-like protein/Tfp pilus assembly protein PilF